MKVHVEIIEHKFYELDIDTDDYTNEQENELYNEISCEPCIYDLSDVVGFIDDKKLNYKTNHYKTFTEIETWR